MILWGRGLKIKTRGATPVRLTLTALVGPFGALANQKILA